MLTGLVLTFMGLTRSISNIFSSPCFILSPVGKREGREKKRRREGGEKEIEKECKEGRKKGRRNKKGSEEK